MTEEKKKKKNKTDSLKVNFGMKKTNSAAVTCESKEEEKTKAQMLKEAMREVFNKTQENPISINK